MRKAHHVPTTYEVHTVAQQPQNLNPFTPSTHTIIHLFPHSKISTAGDGVALRSFFLGGGVREV